MIYFLNDEDDDVDDVDDNMDHTKTFLVYLSFWIKLNTVLDDNQNLKLRMQKKQDLKT